MTKITTRGEDRIMEIETPHKLPLNLPEMGKQYKARKKEKIDWIKSGKRLITPEESKEVWEKIKDNEFTLTFYPDFESYWRDSTTKVIKTERQTKEWAIKNVKRARIPVE